MPVRRPEDPPVRRHTYVLPEPTVVRHGRPNDDHPNDVATQTTAATDLEERVHGTVTFTVNATINVERRDGGLRYCVDRASGTVEDYLDNHADVAMVAPRALAVPGRPYVRIDENADVPTPEHWRRMLADRSSLGPVPVDTDLGDEGPNDGRATAAADTFVARRSRAASADRECHRPGGARVRCKSLEHRRTR